MALALTDDRIGTPPPPPPARPRVLLLATAMALIPITMAFAGLLGLYAQLRSDAIKETGGWLPKGVVIDLTPGNVAMAGLAISAVVVHWAIYCISNDDRPRAYIALGLTALLGGAFINSMAFYWTQMGITVHDGVGALIFAITGLHVAMVAGGMAFVGLVAFRALGGQYSGRDREGLTAAAVYWDVSVLVYAAIWFTIFVTK